MGIGRARGEGRAQKAAEMAINSSLLETSIDGARGILLNISGGSDLSLYEVNEVAEIINSAADPEANIIFGAVVDETLGDTLWVTVVAAGFDVTTEEPGLEESAPAPETAPARQLAPTGAAAVQSARKAPDTPRPTPDVGVLSREDAREATKGLAEEIPGRSGGDDDDLEVPTFLR
jgi:cell division protein FtsZ